MDIIFATHNLNKVCELRKLLKENNCNYNILSLDDLKCKVEVIETGTTFKENSLLKAKAIYEIYKIPVLADDSGLCVDALDGAPGIFSSRYSGGSSSDNIDLLLKNMENIDNRDAHFNCTVCYYDSNPNFFEGIVQGEIGYKRVGQSGFGYDPIFMYEDKSFAAISLDDKNKISHRAKALKKFLSYIYNN
ncbi:MAG: RdgB/HAM1 family non-canonical purine NTP pyrophosphatase [Bacilli bacterium]